LNEAARNERLFVIQNNAFTWFCKIPVTAKSSRS